MLLVSTDRLLPGERLAKPIYTDTGGILVSVHTELTAGMIRRLQDLGISSVYIQDSRTEDIQAEDIVSDEVRNYAVATVQNSFKKMQSAGRDWKKAANLNYREFKDLFETILGEIQSKKDVLIQLSNIYSKDSYLYSHSVNVAIYSAVLGLSLRLNRSQMIDLGIGAILHDIGKIMIPAEILSKPSRLTEEEYEVMKTHTTLGYQMLRNFDEVPLLSAHCALQHHERINGSGYPRKLKGDEIHIYGRIIGICDMYDALVSNRVYRRAELPHTALEMLFGSALDGQFDLALVDSFQKHVAVYPIGLPVKLSTGERAIVAKVDPNCPQRPIVRVLTNENGENIVPFERDLSEELTIMIEECGNVLDPVL